MELGVLAKGLQACSDCKQPLKLTDVVNEKRYGLASILNVLCCCGQINTISTEKCHRSAGSRREVSIYDINTKLATGIYHNFISFDFACQYNLLSIFYSLKQYCPE